MNFERKHEKMYRMKKALVFLLVLTLLTANAALAFADGPSGSASARRAAPSS